MFVKFIKVLTHCIYQSIRHPLTRVSQMSNPMPIEMSPIPWWGSVAILILGIVSWILSTRLNVVGLDEASRAMVYCPLMHIFDMTWFLAKRAK